MNKNEQVIATTVSSFGIVNAPNDRATFSLAIKAKSDALEDADAVLKEKTNAFAKELGRFKTTPIELVQSQSNYKLEHREGSERYAAGYHAVESISFTVPVNEQLNSIFEMCLKFDTAMSAPIFSISNRDELLERATQQAAAKMAAVLDTECKLLGVSKDKLQILNWNFGYDGYIPLTANNGYVSNNVGIMGVTGPQGVQGSPGMNAFTNGRWEPPVSKVGTIYQEILGVKLNPGNVSVRVAVQVNYVWKV